MPAGRLSQSWCAESKLAGSHWPFFNCTNRDKIVDDDDADSDGDGDADCNGLMVMVTVSLWWWWCWCLLNTLYTSCLFDVQLFRYYITRPSTLCQSIMLYLLSIRRYSLESTLFGGSTCPVHQSKFSHSQTNSGTLLLSKMFTSGINSLHVVKRLFRGLGPSRDVFDVEIEKNIATLACLGNVT